MKVKRLEGVNDFVVKFANVNGSGSASANELFARAILRMTGRIMAKDEDVCLHCGLCAERCPTGAWDMQKSLIEMTHAGPAARSPLQKQHKRAA